MNNDKKRNTVILIVLGVFVFISMYLFVGKNNIVEAPDANSVPALPDSTLSEVFIATDKEYYTKGESIEITIKNTYENEILHIDGGDRFWQLEYSENGAWEKYNYDGRTGFQLTKQEVGTECSIAMFERTEPRGLPAGESIVSSWNQKMCPFDSKVVKYTENGTYRIIFYYGFEANEKDRYSLKNPKTVYSNTFTIH